MGYREQGHVLELPKTRLKVGHSADVWRKTDVGSV